MMSCAAVYILQAILSQVISWTNNPPDIS